MGSLLGSPGPWLAVFSPWGMCRAPNCLLALEAWHRWLPRSDTAQPCWCWDPWWGGEMVREASGCVSPSPSLWAPSPTSFLCHMSSVLDHLERWLFFYNFQCFHISGEHVAPQ